MLTGLPSAAAPAVRTAAAWSLSSVPEKRTRFSGSSIVLTSCARRSSRAVAEATLEDAAHDVAGDHHVRVRQPVADLAPEPVGVDQARRAQDGEVLRHV